MRRFSLNPLVFVVMLFAGCNSLDIQNFDAVSAIKNKLDVTDVGGGEPASELDVNMDDLPQLVASTRPELDMSKSFVEITASAISGDPSVIVAQNEVLARQAQLRTTKSGKDFNIDATVLGGVEDVTDEVAGVAAILNMSKLMYDGGQLDAQILKGLYEVKAAQAALLTKQNERGGQLVKAWIDLEKYAALSRLINSRLSVLDPLVDQLERVADSGMADVRQVAAAQRTVAMIRVTRTDVQEKYTQAQIAFRNDFGALPKISKFDGDLISNAVPNQVRPSMVEAAPSVLASYYAYKAAEASVAAVKAQDKFSVALEAKYQEPLGGSGYSSDESIGLVLTKQFYRGDQLSARIESAEAQAEAQANELRAIYKQIEGVIQAADKMIGSMDTSISLARQNVKITQDEIDYLRKQLVIGGSTLDSVLSAEARLYDAESKEIGLLAERRKAEISLLAALGLLGEIFKF